MCGWRWIIHIYKRGSFRDGWTLLWCVIGLDLCALSIRIIFFEPLFCTCVKFCVHRGIPTDVFVFFPSALENSEYEIGFCGWVLISFSILLMLLTLPISIWMCIKVSSGVYWPRCKQSYRGCIYLTLFDSFTFIKSILSDRCDLFRGFLFYFSISNDMYSVE